MSERQLEIARDPDGRFLAIGDPRQPAVEVTSWDDVRRLRGKTHLVDHWAGEDRAAFIALHGHPFDDWWASLSPACAAALLADPHGQIPAEHHVEVKRTLNHQARQSGLELQGSSMSPELRDYVAARAAASAEATPSHG
jgi:hypothetical protein